MLTMVHANAVRIEGDVLRVDRKFHLGMQAYLADVKTPILSMHPEAALDGQTMDLVEVPLSELGYDVLALKTDRASRLLASEVGRARAQIARSSLVYGTGLGSAKLAQEYTVPQIIVLEYDLKTQISVAQTHVKSPLRRGVRAARCTLNYATVSIPEMRRAHSLHCNGYPTFDEARWFNANRLLYLDSRMSADLVIPEDQLRARLAGRTGRPLRLLFSGRYEPMKGAADAVRVGVACLEQGLDVEMHCYGQGSLRAEMERLAQRCPGPARIHVHDAVPYPELVRISRTFDLFVCCHIQADPSCTYLESFGAGLPVVGYGNRMWRRLSLEASVGSWSPVGQPQAVANDIKRLALDFAMLAGMSERARSFALEHAFEHEFRRRTDALNAALDRSSARH
jgi:colanic acid/amylovoran biosynthesis glycosyltransferase